VFQVDFDPAKLAYEELLRQIWANRRGGRSYSRQYMEAVFCSDAEQEATARRLGISVPIVSDARFYLAEDYHQKYYLRHDRTLIAELADYTPRELVESTVAARLNGYISGGYVSGRSTLAQLHDELPQLGLSAAAATHLERLVASRAR
jgi:peptide-methionine (S)-S-oxide reductase